VLEASSIVEVDFTAAEVLIDAIRKARSEGVEFAIARLESVRAASKLERFGVMDVLGPHHLFHSVHEAIMALDPAAAGANPGSGPGSGPGADHPGP
jgi:MFS superfamily sulfate permease-like transporter